jgi:hypothetical protein
MKKIQTALLMMLVACMGLVVQSCSNDDEIQLKRYYRCEGYVDCVKGYEAKAQAFNNDLNAVMQSLTNQTANDDLVKQKVQTVVDKYNNDVLYGYVDLKAGDTQVSEYMTTIKRYTLTANPQYLAE